MSLGDRLIGPGMPCMHCGQSYGQHDAACAQGQRQRDAQQWEDQQLGARIRQALAAENDAQLGQILREFVTNQLP